jgi:hypothetical protein
MTARKIKTQPPSLAGSPVSIYYDSDYEEYQVRIKGRPDDTYFTDDKADAVSTAIHMRNTAFLEPKRNPIKDSRQLAPGAALALRVVAPNDSNGNPRRGWIVWDAYGSNVGFVEEEYYGRAALQKALDGKSFRDLGELPVTAGVYRDLKKGN